MRTSFAIVLTVLTLCLSSQVQAQRLKPLVELDQTNSTKTLYTLKRCSSFDLPLNFHPAAIRAWAVFDMPNGAVRATGGNAKLPHCVALEPVAAMIPA